MAWTRGTEEGPKWPENRAPAITDLLPSLVGGRYMMCKVMEASTGMPYRLLSGKFLSTPAAGEWHLYSTIRHLSNHALGGEQGQNSMPSL